MTKKKRLGRGIQALLGATAVETPEGDIAEPPVSSAELAAKAAIAEHQSEGMSAEAEPTNGSLLLLDITAIEVNPFQPRRVFSEAEINSLAESLKQHDMLSPILVRKVNGNYQLISGERRLRAATQAGWTKIPARIREADDRLVAELAIVENLQRQDLNPLEKAMSFRRYINEHQCTQEQLAGRLSIDRSTIANLMRLLELPQSVQGAITAGAISAGHARALLPLGDEKQQTLFCGRIQKEGLSVRAVESLVQETIKSEDSSKSKAKQRAKNQHIAALEQELRHAVGAKVSISQSSRGRGTIQITFANHDEFERIRDILIGQPSFSAVSNRAG